MNWTGKSSSGGGSLWRQVSGQWWKSLVVARIIGEFHSNWLGTCFWDCAIQFLNCTLGLLALIETNESDTFREA
jgi:hypothetical protein